MNPPRNTQRTSIAPPSPLRVALVDDKLEIRTTWSELISSFQEFRCVCVCSSGADALARLPEVKPDVVLMDIHMPGMSGIECTARLRRMLPSVNIVMLTEVDDDEMVFLALEAGADGYLLKRSKPGDLRAGLNEVVSGGAPMSSGIARRVVEFFHRRPRKRPDGLHLTPREEEVLLLLSQGYSNKEIADRLNMGIETVRSHLKHVYEKMHVRSRAEAVGKMGDWLK
jgi:DNA-binding NarL/FixJ family response regulator